ncbi:MAG: hypothetical protein KDA42_02465, partial [Planctomycetales bacterium]|nr:hypothetical protein [Planctomycetales bacterium]
MTKILTHNRATLVLLGVALGLVMGVVGSRLLAPVPVAAVATHGGEQFAMATGPVDDRFEALFFLDYLTGDLSAAVLNTRGGGFNSMFKTNVLKDFGGAIGKNPK